MFFLRSLVSLFLLSLSIEFSSSQVFATVFFPAPLSKQVEAADAVIQGDFVQKSSKRMNGQIVTEYQFRVQRYATKNSLDIALQNKEYVQFYQPGGVLGKDAVSVSGTADFKPHEFSTLILKKGSDGLYWLASLGLGKYDSIKFHSKTYWSSTIFPKHKDLGRITDQDWEKLIAKNFKTSWKSVLPEVEIKSMDKNKIVYEQKNKSQRKIASEKPKPYSFTWMITAMAILFVLGMWLSKEKQVNE
jgi:hypothetical protein